ncbi:putative fluoride ion transporter CrcB [bioreactor metagenome]|uniref:Putative fluoride ion transporter CrcB n=1 Tax=bioreactor metagenome TaxID=1076179 RepID=A0A645IPU4_9ZZZZ
MGGCIGSALRYAVSYYSPKWFGTPFPCGTLIVNAAGGFLIGCITDLCLSANTPAELRLFLTTGILGGFTTFSTFGYETVGLFAAGSSLLGVMNICLNLFTSLGGVVLGKWVADVFAGT